MKRNYSLTADTGHRYETSVKPSFFIDDALAIDISSTTPARTVSAGHTYVSKDDAIDFAWSILEHYGVTERPPAPLAVGDFVVIQNGELGKVVKVDSDEPALFVEDMNGHRVWRFTENATRITKEEFVKSATEKAVGAVSKFVEEN